MPSKKVRLQLYADENFPLTSVKHFRSLGISIVHCYSMNYVQKPDKFHLKKSKSLKRILITRDRDFTYNWSTLKGHPGVILVSSSNQTANSINNVCDKAFPKLTPQFISESLVKISLAKITRNKNEKIERLKI